MLDILYFGLCSQKIEKQWEKTHNIMVIFFHPFKKSKSVQVSW